MCTRYRPPNSVDLEAVWRIDRSHGQWAPQLHPLSAGPFLRASSDGLQLVVGQWGMIPPDSETRIPMSRPRGPGERPKRIATVNARTETVRSRPTYRDAWKRGQRCIIPAESFDEPNWETGKNVWWRFRRADGAPWGIAGLWSEWTDPGSGEVVPSYTMLTMNADEHPLMSRMHKPDPKLAPDKQDKRSVVVIERGDEDAWLSGSESDAMALIRLAPVGVFAAGPADEPGQQSALAI